MGESNYSSNTTCGHEPVDDVRFIIVVLIGTPIAAMGILTNTMLIALFLQVKYRNSPTLYLLVLAVLDLLICGIYIFLFTFDALGLYLMIYELWWAWHQFVMPLLTLSRITQMSSTYMVVCATVERFLIVKESQSLRFLYSIQGRKLVVAGTLLFCIAMRLITFWEYRIVDTDCAHDFETLQFQEILVLNPLYKTVYNVYIMQPIQVYIPFILLLVMNVLIVCEMRQKVTQLMMANKSGGRLVEQSLVNNGETHLSVVHHVNNVGTNGPVTNFRPRSNTRHREQKKKLKTATYTLVAIVTTYLICNAMDTTVKFLELVAPHVLTNEFGESTAFYTISTDIVSLLFLCNSFVRFFIYMACNGELRDDMKRKLQRLRTHSNRPGPAAEQNLSPRSEDFPLAEIKTEASDNNRRNQERNHTEDLIHFNKPQGHHYFNGGDFDPANVKVALYTV